MTLKQMFPGANTIAYLDSAAEGLSVPRCKEAFAQYFSDKQLGTPGRTLFQQAESEALELTATLLRVERNNVAFVSNASEALYILASSLEWKPGDEIIISALEFPSNIVPWLRLQDCGVRLIVVPDEQGAFNWRTVADHISSRTRLVSLSLVSYKTGAYFEGIPHLATEVRRAGAFLSIDGTQALGRCPVSLDGIDYFMSSTFKWLMGPHGLGIVYLSPRFREILRPASMGWYSVQHPFAVDRFERYELKEGAGCLSAGMPNYASIYALRESLQFLQKIKVEVIYEELRPLVEKLYRGFQDLKCNMLTPRQTNGTSGIVAFKHDKADKIGATLAEEGVIVWGGDNRVRASVHLYNDMTDIDRCLSALDKALKLHGR